MGNTVLRLHRVADNSVAGAARAGVVTEADQLGKIRHLGDQADVVEIEDAAAVCLGKGILIRARIVRGEQMSSPRAPAWRDKINSAMDEQSKPKPSSESTSRMWRLGSAFTA